MFIKIRGVQAALRFVPLKPWLCWRIWGSGEAGCGLRNQVVKGIKWSSLHHKSLLESFHFPALVSACFNRELLCTFKGIASAGISHSGGLH